MRQEHRVGEKLFVDFSGEKIPIHDRRTGEVTLRAELFVAVAGASNYLFAEAFASQELLYWVSGHTHAFEFMGGCHEIVVCDNLKAGVTRPHRYEPDVSAAYQEMAAHHGIAIIPTRTYKLRDKACASDYSLLIRSGTKSSRPSWQPVVNARNCPNAADQRLAVDLVVCPRRGRDPHRGVTGDILVRDRSS